MVLCNHCDTVCYSSDSFCFKCGTKILPDVESLLLTDDETEPLADVEKEPLADDEEEEEEDKPAKVAMRKAIPCHGINFEFVYGDLRDSTEDVVVNSTGDDINLNVSVAKALAGKAGNELRKACESLRPLKIGDVVVTEGYDMPCEQILHCNCHYFRDTNNNSKLLEMLFQCMEMADEMDHESIAFPAIGMGVKGYPPKLVIKSLIDATATYSSSNPESSLSTVKLYIYPGAFSTEQFEEFLQYVPNVGVESVVKVEGTKSEVHIGNAAEVKTDIVIDFIGSDEPVCSLSVSASAENKNPLQQELDDMGKCFAGQITMTDGSGLNCSKILHVFCPPKWKQNETDMLLQNLIHNCLCMGNGMGAKSVVFASINTDQLNYPPTAFAKCYKQALTGFYQNNAEPSVMTTTMIVEPSSTSIISGFGEELGLNLTPYSVEENEEVQLGIKADDLDNGPKLGLPFIWKKPVIKHQFVTIYQRSREYGLVATEFTKSLNKTDTKFEILEIIRVQNEASYLLYSMMRKNVAAKLHKPEENIETTSLWHGTKKENAKEIAKTKFDRGLSGTCGGNLLGANCCYFATTSKYSDTWLDACAPDGKYKEKYMFMVRVVTGEHCLGEPAYKMAPYNPASNEQYDSVVDNLDDPTKFAVFHDAAAYPEYIIRYKRTK